VPKFRELITIAERLILSLKTFAAPGNVERKYATKVGGETATLAHYLSNAKKAVHEESGFLEFELAAETEGPSAGIKVSGSLVEKFALNVTDISSVIEY
jgi:hypothetical protein